MRPKVRRFIWLTALLALLTSRGMVLGQSRTNMAPRQTVWVNGQQKAAEEDALPDVFSTVSFIDSALPRNTLRLRVDWATHFKRPTMAEVFQPKGGLPFSPGPSRPETSVDFMDFSTYLEWAPDTWFSVFLNTPIRMVNPDQNPNTWGNSDLDLGFKVGIFAESRFLTTFQLRLYVPSASNSALGTEHFSIEPALLANYRIFERFQLEGEVRYWKSMGGTDFAGDFIRYGLGLSYGAPSGDVIWFSPVVEVVGWTLKDGHALRVEPGFLGIDDVANQTIVNAQAGVRVGFGHNMEIYAGYSRCLTGYTWYREMARVEFRWLY